MDKWSLTSVIPLFMEKNSVSQVKAVYDINDKPINLYKCLGRT